MHVIKTKPSSLVWVIIMDGMALYNSVLCNPKQCRMLVIPFLTEALAIFPPQDQHMGASLIGWSNYARDGIKVGFTIMKYLCPHA